MIFSVEYDRPAEWDEVFSGCAPIASTKDLVKQELDNFVAHLEFVVHLRGFCAATGAMRWPWSQEAPIEVDHTIRI